MGNKHSQQKQPVAEEPSTTMYNLTFSHVISQYLYIVAKLDVATIIDKAGKPLTAEEIANQHGGTINVDYLERILRLLSSTKGIFDEVTSQGDTPAFGMTEFSRLLTSDTKNPLRQAMLHALDPATWRAYSHVEECVTTKEPVVAFKKETGMGLFEYYKTNQELAKIFNDSMTIISYVEADTIMSSYCDAWKELETKEATVLDVGGGHGLMMKRVKQQYPKLKCTVLDLKEVIDNAPEEECGVDFIVGDFFKADTLPKTDVVFMKHILPMWDDEDANTILKSCHLALSEGGKLVLFEIALPGAGDKAEKKGLNPFFMDAQQMTVMSGRQRTIDGWKKLLGKSGFQFEKIVETPVTLTLSHIIEAHKI